MKKKIKFGQKFFASPKIWIHLHMEKRNSVPYLFRWEAKYGEIVFCEIFHGKISTISESMELLYRASPHFCFYHHPAAWVPMIPAVNKLVWKLWHFLRWLSHFNPNRISDNKSHIWNKLALVRCLWSTSNTNLGVRLGTGGYCGVHC